MNTKRAHIVDAVIRYIYNKGLTPYIVVDINYPGVVVPTEYASNGFITLNLALKAIGNYELGDDGLRFSARFNRVARHMVVPLQAICSVYPREDIADMVHFVKIEGTHFSGCFVDEEIPHVAEVVVQPAVERQRPKLTIVKGTDTTDPWKNVKKIDQRLDYSPISGVRLFPGGTHPDPRTSAGYREYFPGRVWHFNPWTGSRRLAADIRSDPYGFLIIP